MLFFCFRLLPKSEMRTRGNKLPDFKLHFNMRPTRKEQKDLIASTSKYAKDRIDSLSNILRPVTNIPNVSQINKAKRGKTRLELIPAFKMSDFPPGHGKRGTNRGPAFVDNKKGKLLEVTNG